MSIIHSLNGLPPKRRYDIKLLISLMVIISVLSIDRVNAFSVEPNEQVRSVAVQPDGKILVAGWFSVIGGIEKNWLARLNADGSVDGSFNTTLLSENFFPTVKIIVQPDGKIILAGNFTFINGGLNRGLVRLNSDGSLDNSFSYSVPEVVETEFVYDAALQGDGKIVAVIARTPVLGPSRSIITRLNSDGSPDQSFDTVNEFGIDVDSGNQFFSRIAIAPDGKIAVSGQFKKFAGRTVDGLARLDANGVFDDTFNVEFGTSGPFGDTGGKGVTAITYQLDGKLLVGGRFSVSVGTSNVPRGEPIGGLVRLNIDGSVDAGFDLSIEPSLGSFFRSIVLKQDGGIIVAGRLVLDDSIETRTRALIAQFKSDGSINQSFAPLIVTGGFPEAFAIAMQSNGKLIVGGLISNLNPLFRLNLVRLFPNGQIDNSGSSNTPCIPLKAKNNNAAMICL